MADQVFWNLLFYLIMISSEVVKNEFNQSYYPNHEKKKAVEMCHNIETLMLDLDELVAKCFLASVAEQLS